MRYTRGRDAFFPVAMTCKGRPMAASSSSYPELKQLLEQATKSGDPPPQQSSNINNDNNAYRELPSSPQVSESGETLVAGGEPGCGKVWLWVMLALTVAVSLALLWRELKRHCASEEERLWGLIEVPVAIRIMRSARSSVPAMAAAVAPSSRSARALSTVEVSLMAP